MAVESQRIKAGLVIRRFRPEEADILIEISQEAGTAAAWPNESYEQLGADATVALVSEWNGVITGFIIGRQIADEAEVLNLAVRQPFRQQGHASALLSTVVEEFRNRHAIRVFLEVRNSNSVAISLYAKHGFVKSGQRKAYYHDPDEDAVCMEKKLTY
jgi:[ribosomal protein S18]-alanine N-acetyltransferase